MSLPKPNNIPKELPRPLRDATGTLLDTSKLYCKTQKGNGFTSFIVGWVIGTTSRGRVTLEIIARGRAFYKRDVERDNIDRRRLSTHANGLVQIDPEYFEDSLLWQLQRAHTAKNKTPT